MSRRVAFLASLLALLAAGAPAAVAAPSAQVRVVACETGADPEERAVTFEARMDAVRGARQLRMRFTLQAATPDQPRFRAVAAPGFGTWHSAEEGVQRYVYAKRVEALLAPARYRVLVAFRWLDGDGSVLARARRRSRPCAQPDPRREGPGGRQRARRGVPG